MRRCEVLVAHDTEIIDRLALLIPGNMTRYFFDRTIDTAEFVADLDDRISDESRIETKGALDLLLYADGRVELHDEVVALSVMGLVFHRRPREVELSPILEAADHAPVVEDLLACRTCDSGDEVSFYLDVEINSREGAVLFHGADVARPGDYYQLVKHARDCGRS